MVGKIDPGGRKWILAVTEIDKLNRIVLTGMGIAEFQASIEVRSAKDGDHYGASSGFVLS